MTPTSPLGAQHRDRPGAGDLRRPGQARERRPAPRSARTSSSITGRPCAAASPTGPPAAPNGSSDQADSSAAASAERARRRPARAPATQVDAQPLAAQRGAQRGQDQRQARRRVRDDQPAGQAVQPGQLAARGGVHLLPGQQRDDVVRVHLAGRTSATTRPCRSTTIRSASRNIWSMSWQASRTVVPCSRTPTISSSTCADIGHAERGGRLVQQQQPGPVRPSPGRPRPAGAGRRTGTGCRAWGRSAMPRSASSRARPRCASDLGQQVPPPLPAEHAGSRRCPGCRTAPGPARRTLTPWRASSAAGRRHRPPADPISPLVGAMSPAMQRTSVVLPAPFSPGQGDDLALAHCQADAVERLHRAEAD